MAARAFLRLNATADPAKLGLAKAQAQLNSCSGHPDYMMVILEGNFNNKTIFPMNVT